MKKRCLIIFILITSLNAFSQSPVIHMQNYFQLNHQYEYKIQFFYDSTMINQNAGNSGANKVWDFPWLSFATNYYSLDTLYAIEPVGSLYYPASAISGNDTSNFCRKNKSQVFNRDEDYQYYKLDNNHVYKLGNNNDNGVIEEVNFQYNDLKTEFIFPMMYQDNFADSFHLTYFDYLSGMHYVDGMDSISVDGSGTLIVDGRTYLNCLRVKDVYYSTNTNINMPDRHTYTETYTWFCEEIEGPVLILERWYDPYLPGTRMSTGTYFLPNDYVVTRIKEQNKKYVINIYPNPAKNEINIDLEENVSADIELINVSGQTLMKLNKNNRFPVKIDISKFAKGTYFISIKQNEKNYLEKFIKQ